MKIEENLAGVKLGERVEAPQIGAAPAGTRARLFVFWNRR